MKTTLAKKYVLQVETKSIFIMILKLNINQFNDYANVSKLAPLYYNFFRIKSN